MTPEQKHLVRTSWDSVLPIAATAADLFYDRLFELDPELKRHFAKTDMTVQKQKLITALATVIAGLDQPEGLLGPLQEMGRRHAGYGVADRDYETVGEALIWTLQQGLGEAFGEAVRDAWTAAYTMIAGQMQAGAKSAAIRSEAA